MKVRVSGSSGKLESSRRRDVLRAAAAGALWLPALARPALAGTSPDVEIRLTAAPGVASVWPGATTRVLRYTATVLKGRADAVRASTGYLGPTLDLRKGERVRIEFVNRLDQPSIVHWHGMLVPAAADGHPMDAVGPGKAYRYEFTVRNPAGTYLYHPHPHGRTGGQVYAGLAGLLIVRDAAERAAGLPPFERELSIAIQDRRIDSDRQFQFKRTMMDDMTGVLGDTPLINGMADARFAVSRAAWRLRLANVSNARIYKLAWSDGRPLQVISAGSGLFSRVEGVQTRSYVVLAPFQRIEIVEDFATREAGAEVSLVSMAFEDPEATSGTMDGGMAAGGMAARGMPHGAMTGHGTMDQGASGGGATGGDTSAGMGAGVMGSAQGEAMTLARFVIASGSPGKSAPPMLPDPEPPIRMGSTRLHTLVGFDGMRGLLNGRRFEMTAVAADERLPLGEGTEWTFEGDASGHAMPHPMHIHGARFRILERSGRAPADLREGLVDAGYQDTFQIFPGERVRVALAPTDAGMFMYHCHNLEHEDGGMMRNCWFGPGAPVAG